MRDFTTVSLVLLLICVMAMTARAQSNQTPGIIDSASRQSGETVTTAGSITAPGNLTVTVMNAEGWGGAGPNAWVDLFNSSNLLISTVQTSYSSTAFFENVPAGIQYWYRVNYNRNPPKLYGREYWGYVTNIAITGGQNTNDTFVRSHPYVLSVKAYDTATNQEITGPIPLGTTIRVDLVLKNPNERESHTSNTKTRLVLDRDRAGSYDFRDSSSYYPVNPGSQRTYSYSFSPVASGTYSYVSSAATEEYGQPSTSDCSEWGTLFTVVADPPPAPVLSSPSNGANGVPTNPQLLWNASSTASSYRLQVADDQSFSRLVIDQPGITNTNFQVNGLSQGTKYYWRVNATNSFGVSTWSEVWSFSTLSPTGTVKITVENAEDWGLVTAWGTVELYDNADQLVATQNTDWSSVATFSNIQAQAGYWYRVYYNRDPAKPFGREYWGSKTGIVVTGGQTSFDTFVRNRPYIPRIRVFVDATNQEVSGPVATGTRLRIDLVVKNPQNPGATDLSARTRLVIDENQALPLDFADSSDYFTMSIGDTLVSSFLFTPTIPGHFKYVSGVIILRYSEPILCDGSSWATLFTVGSLPPEPPELVSPANLATEVPFTPALTWNPSIGATSYRAQLSTSALFDSIKVDQPGIAGTSVIVGPLQAATTYYWRVNASGTSGTGNWSTARAFTTAGNSGSLTVTIETADGGMLVGDRARVDLLNILGQTIRTASTDVASVARFTEVQAGKDYRYRVFFRPDSMDQFGFQYWGQRDSIEIVRGQTTDLTFQRNAPSITSVKVFDAVTNLELSAPVLFGRELRIIATVLNPGFAGARVQQIRSRLLLDRDRTAPIDFADTSYSLIMSPGTLNQFAFSHTPSAAGTYALAAALECQLDGATILCDGEGWADQFTVLDPPPIAPVLQAPANTATGVNTAIAFSWLASPGATLYHLQVATSAGFETRIVDQPNIAALSAAVGGLAEGTTYHWRVSASNTGGTGPWSSAWSFTTAVNLPSVPVLAQPANGLVGVPTSTVLSWNAVTGALSYRAQLAVDSLFVAPQIDDSSLTSTSLAMVNLTKGVRYYWRVRAKNDAGVGPWSPRWNFTTVMPSPGPALLMSPAQNALVSADTVRLSWSRCTPQVTQYLVEVALDSMFLYKNADSSLQDTFKVVRQLAAGQTYHWRVSAKNAMGWGPVSEMRKFRVMYTAVDRLPEALTSVRLDQNYPNPFNPSTTIRYGLPQRGNVELTVHNTLGQLVASLVRGDRDAGYHEVSFDASTLPSGVYFYRIRTGSHVETRRLILMK